MALPRALTRMIGATSIAGAVACTTAGQVTTLSPAPRECPTGIVRLDTLPAAEVVERMHGHVPNELPAGFGLVEAWGDVDGSKTAAMWADGTCREVIMVLGSTSASSPDGPKVGAWVLTADASGDCGNAVLGKARCLGYRAEVPEGTLIVQMMGIERSVGDEIVLSIPT